jgi:hypothetical protein
MTTIAESTDTNNAVVEPEGNIINITSHSLITEQIGILTAIRKKSYQGTTHPRKNISD